LRATASVDTQYVSSFRASNLNPVRSLMRTGDELSVATNEAIQFPKTAAAAAHLGTSGEMRRQVSAQVEWAILAALTSTANSAG
jgi:hypothetical protein